MEGLSKKVLLVGGEIQLLHVVALKLREGGYEVFTSQDGLGALETAQIERPDVLITDYQIPGLSGLELCQRLRHLPSTREIPVVMMMAGGIDLEETTLAEMGIEVCLKKPFSCREMLAAVDELISVCAI